MLSELSLLLTIRLTGLDDRSWVNYKTENKVENWNKTAAELQK